MEELRRLDPASPVETLDLFKADLPPFDGLAVQAKYSILHGQSHSAEEKRAWAAVEKIISHFLSADRYVFAVPMWNFGLPYRLKHYIDLVVQPGYTFSFSPETGYQGLVKNRRALVVYAQGGSYPGGSEEAAYDLQTKAMNIFLGFIGIAQVDSIVAGPTLAEGPDGARAHRDAAVAKALELARRF